jgi:cell wall assembly regulator SMI1
VLNVDEGLPGALSRLEGVLVQSRAAIVPLLHPGIDEAEVVSLLAGVGLTPSAEFVTWYGWHDGAGAPGLPSMAIELVPGGEFYDLRYLCGEYQQARSAAEYVASTAADLPSKTGLRVTADDLWRVSWFPLLRLFGKGLLAVDLADNEGSTSPVHIVWHDSDPEERARVAWERVGSFVETVIGRFEEGVYSVDDDGIVQGPTIDHPSQSR